MEEYNPQFVNNDQYDPQLQDNLRPEENNPQREALPQVQNLAPNQILQRDIFPKSQVFSQPMVSPLKYSNVITQPIFTSALPVVHGVNQVATAQPQLVSQQQVVSGQTQFVGTQLVTASQTKREAVKGESRIEYVPYEKTIVEYEAVQRTEYIPKEKKVTDYYAVEYQTEYVPQVYQDKYIEYIPQERVTERVEYQAVQKQVVHKPQETVQQAQYVQTEVVQQPVYTQQVVQQPVYTQQVVQQPVYTQQVVQQPVYAQQVVQQPIVTQQFVQQPVPTQQVIQQPIQYVTSQQVVQKPVQYVSQQVGQQAAQVNSVPLGTTSFAAGSASTVYPAQRQLAGSIMLPSQIQKKLPPALQNSTILPPPQSFAKTLTSPTFLQQSVIQPAAYQQEPEKKKKEKKGFLEQLFD